MEVPEVSYSPLARVGLWLPLSTLAAFAVGEAFGLFAFPDAVLCVTFLAALGWVVVGISGGVAGPLSRGTEKPPPSPKEKTTSNPDAIDGATAVLTYLSVTTTLGWAAILLFVGL